MQAFDLQHRTRFVFGPGKLALLGSIALQLGGRRVLVVTDPGLVQAGHFRDAVARLEESGLQVDSFHDFGENPTSAMVDAGVSKAAEFQPDILVGLGGGSSMDCCKGINFVYSCGGRISDYHGVGKATADLLPMIAVPTTTGTGSEAQSFALISDAESHVKMACGDARAACRVAILDPELVTTQPRSVAALTGIDAISHAIETYVTRRRNPFSVTYSRRAFGLLAAGFTRLLETPDDLEAASEMQLGACFAGMAIEASMLGAAHATANPLTARLGTIHGQAVGLMLPAVIRFNARPCQTRGGAESPHATESPCVSWYGELMREMDPTVDQESASDRLAECVTEWLVTAGCVTRLSQLGVTEASIDRLADDALKQWTGTFNPVALTKEAVTEIYRSVL